MDCARCFSHFSLGVGPCTKGWTLRGNWRREEGHQWATILQREALIMLTRSLILRHLVMGAVGTSVDWIAAASH